MPKHANRSPGRGGYPLSLHPLTPEEAIRRALSALPPAKEQKPKAKAKPTSKAKKKRGG